jgi:hypothetical protein
MYGCQPFWVVYTEGTTSPFTLTVPDWRATGGGLVAPDSRSSASASSRWSTAKSRWVC